MRAFLSAFLHFLRTAAESPMAARRGACQPLGSRSHGCAARRRAVGLATFAAFSTVGAALAQTTVDIAARTSPVPAHMPAPVARVTFTVNGTDLLVHFESAEGPTLQLRTARRAPDDVIDSDTQVLIYIDGSGTAKFARVFVVTPSGGVADGTYREGGAFDTGADFRWNVHTSRTATGWTADLVIPIESLGLTKAGTPRTYIEYRRRLATAETFANADPNEAAGCLLCAAVPLPGLRSSRSSPVVWQLTPSLYALKGRATQDGGVSSYSQVQKSATGVLQIGDQLELRGTYMPNFAEREPDDPVIRFGSQFPSALPERRQFFARSSDLLDTNGLSLINTRTIANPKLALAGEWRNDVWRASGITAQDQAGNYVILPGTYSSTTALAPASRILIGRGVTSSLSGDLGVTASSRSYEGVGSTEMFAVDAARRLGDGYSASALLAQSTTGVCSSGEVLVSCPSRSGRAAYASVARATPLSGFKLSVTDISPQFRSDNGWLTQVGYRSLDASWREEFPNVVHGIDTIRIKPGLSMSQDSDGRSLVRSLWLTSEMEAHGRFLAVTATPLNQIRLESTSAPVPAATVSVTGIVSPGPTWTRLGAKVTVGQLPDFAHGLGGRGWSSGVESYSAWAGGVSLQLTALTYRTRAVDAVGPTYEDLEALAKVNWQYSTWSRVRFVTTVSHSKITPIPTGSPQRQRTMAHSVIWEHAPRLGWTWTLGLTDQREFFSGSRTTEALVKVGYTF